MSFHNLFIYFYQQQLIKIESSNNWPWVEDSDDCLLCGKNITKWQYSLSNIIYNENVISSSFDNFIKIEYNNHLDSDILNLINIKRWVLRNNITYMEAIYQIFLIYRQIVRGIDFDLNFSQNLIWIFEI